MTMRARIATAGAGVKVSSAITNALQDEQIAIQDGILSDISFYLLEEFIGSGTDFSTTRFSQSLVTNSGVASFVDDSANGAVCGAVELHQGGTNDWAAAVAGPDTKVVAGGMWRYQVRARLVDWATLWSSGALAIIGLGDLITFQVNGPGGTHATWVVNVNGGAVVHDTGVTPDSAYHTFDVLYVGGVITAKIDGVIVYSGTVSVGPLVANLRMQSGGHLHTTTDGASVIDAAFMRVYR